MINKQYRPSSLTRYTGTLWFILTTLGALLWFFSAALDLTSQLLSMPEAIVFNKGIFYLPGVGIGLGAISVAAIYQFWLNRSLSDRLSTIITRTALLGLLITFILPHLAHYSVSSYVEARGYSVCHKASHQWLHSRVIVFFNSGDTCRQLVSN